MPTDETRRLLRVFGVAVTTYEDAITSKEPKEKVLAAQAEAQSALKEIEALLQRLDRSKDQ
jgi:hypothetical protein